MGERMPALLLCTLSEMTDGRPLAWSLMYHQDSKFS